MEEIVLDLADDVGKQAGVIIIRQGIGRMREGGRVNKDGQREAKDEDDEKAAH